MRGFLLVSSTAVALTDAFLHHRPLQFHHKTITAQPLQLVGSTIIEIESQVTTAPSLTLDPLISRLLLNDEQDNDILDYGSVLTASQGIAIWRSALLKGRLPMSLEFEDNLWPQEPLFAQTQAAMADLQFPRFVLKHPDTVNAVLRTILRMTTQFSRQIGRAHV